jgi:hypothetical protein
VIVVIANDVVFLDRYAHVTSIPTLAPIPFILADAALNADASVFASLARALAVAALFALPTTLATWLCR